MYGSIQSSVHSADKLFLSSVISVIVGFDVKSVYAINGHQHSMYKDLKLLRTAG